MPGTLLLMDNMQGTLDKWGSLLEEVGYSVEKAPTLEQAEHVLTNEWVHLAILDIRMIDEDDENDISGLLLAQKPEFSDIPKIILTAFQSFEYVRAVLTPNAHGIRSAENFIAKDEGPRALIEAIAQVFKNQVRINWDLQIQWEPREHLSFFHLVSLVQKGLSNHLLAHRASEMEDLFRKLFYDYKLIRVGRLLWHDSQRFCLPVLAQTPQGTVDARLLICGDRERLAQDREKLGEFAPGAIREARLSGAPVETTHFGTLLFELPDANIEMVQTLREIFQVGRERPLKAALANLLDEILPAWHQHGHSVGGQTELMALYRQWAGLPEAGAERVLVEQHVGTLIQSVRALKAIEIEQAEDRLAFRFPHQPVLNLPNPVSAVYTPLALYPQPVVCRVSPGRITLDNILVDEDQQTWLTDFGLAGQAPQWWDFICLEAAIHFDLSQTADLVSWQEFEKCVLKPAQLDEGLDQDSVPSELRTSVVLIEQVRRQAASETGPDPLPYYAGLLAWAVASMAHYDPGILFTQADRLRGAHLLLAAAMLAGRLKVTPSVTPQGGILRFDGDGTVWIGSQRAAVLELMSAELSLLRCLFEANAHPGQFVSRKEIVEAVYKGEKYDATDKTQEQRVNALVSRLRGKIEPYPDQPRYILTTRGGGYRLQVSGESEQ